MEGYLQKKPGGTKWQKIFASEASVEDSESGAMKILPLLDTFIVDNAGKVEGSEEEIRVLLEPLGAVSRFELEDKRGKTKLLLGVMKANAR